MPKYLSFLLLSILIVLLAFASIQLWAPADETNSVQLTATEIQWLKDHPVIKVAIDPDFAPYEFHDGQQAQGIAMDYLEYIEYQHGIKFEIARFKDWTDSLDSIRNKKADMLSAVGDTPQRSEYMLFTESYISMQNVVLIRSDTSDDFADTDLATMHVAVIKDYIAQDLLELHYPGIRLYKATDISDGLRSLSLGQVDAFVVDSAQAAYYIPKIGANNLKMNKNISLGFDLPLHFGIRKDAPELRSILSKIINSIPEEIDEQIQNNWKTNSFEPGINTQLFVSVIILVAVIALSGFLMVLWNSTLNAQVEQKTENMRSEIEKRITVEEQLRKLINAIPYPVSVKDTKGIYIYANSAYSDLINVPVANIIGNQDMDLLDISPTITRSVMSDGDVTVLRSQQPYTIKSIEVPLARGHKVFDITKLPFQIDETEPNGILSFSVDITEQHDSQVDLKNLNEHLEEIVEQRLKEFTEKNDKLLESFTLLQTSEQNLTALNNELSTSLDVLQRTQDKLVEVEKFAALGRSASGIAHELNTPIGIGISAVTYGFSEIKSVSDKVKDRSISVRSIVNKLERVEQSLDLVDSSISKMLDIAKSLDKLTTTQWKEEDDSFLLRNLIHECFERTQKRLKEDAIEPYDDIQLNIECDPELKINTSLEACRTVFDSLLHNSFVHGFVTYKDPKIIRIECSLKGNQINIHYEDNGVGVNSEDLSKIMEPLYTSRRGSNNLGLGLSIVYNIIVKNLDGKLKIRNVDTGGLALDFDIKLNNH